MGTAFVKCEETKDLLDAYALGAVDQDEAYQLEGHVADCLDCWEELNKSRRTAALLSLSVPLKRAPDHLRRRIMSQAQLEEARDERRVLFPRLRLNWRSAVGALGTAAVAALLFSSVLQVQVIGLRDDNSQISQQLNAASTELDQQRQIVAILSASDSQKIPMDAASARSQAESVYNWSRDTDAGFVVCDNFPALPAGQVYQVWFTTTGRAEPVVSFVPNEDGGCQIPLDLSRVNSRTEGIGISIEPEGGRSRPSRGWFAFASFNESSRRSGDGFDFAVSAFGP
jgi:Anti-sigma-K factor rskA, C-terminal/Putative zinc-finger